MSSTPQREPKLACLVCRQRKVACDRQRPRCGLCTKNDFDCVYKSRQQRPGLRAGYVSRLEQQLEAVQERLERVEDYLGRGSPNLPFNVERSRASLPLADDGQLESDPSGPDLAEGTGDVPRLVPETVPQTRIIVNDESPVPTGPLLLPTAPEVFKTWFRSYHHWFPILHQGSFQELSAFENPDQELICKAVTAVVTFDQADRLSWHQARAAELRDQVLLQCVATSSLQSVQTLLILSNHFYAWGRLTEFWNVLAICKRMLAHPDLQMHWASPPCPYTSRVRMAQCYSTSSSVVKEEARRAFWMVEMLDAISTLGLPHSMPYLPSPLRASLPCLESQWSSTPTMIQRSNSGPRYSSGFTLCVMLSVDELKTVRQFLGRYCELDKLDQRFDWQSEAQRLDERLTNWREEFVAAVFQLINYEKEHLPRGEMESFFTLTNCVLNSAIITLLQQMAPMPKGIETTFEPWAFATTRCTYACENLTAKVRRIGADRLEIESPYLISPLFVAARFYIVYSKALDADVPANLHTLAFILHACGQRWPLAQLYETIIRTAVAEHRSPISECVLPIEFYDFRHTTLEITELLQRAGMKLA